MLRTYVNELPMITTHEHIGSLLSANFTGNLFAPNPDTRPGAGVNRTTLLDLVFSPYLSGCLISVGYRNGPAHTRFSQMNEDEQNQVWQGVAPFLKLCRGTGLYIALDLALKDLYGSCLEDLIDGAASWQAISEKVQINYRKGLAAWSREMFETAGIIYAVKPVHTPFLQRMWDDSLETTEEKKIFLPILRIDDMLGWKTAESLCSWKHMEETLGIKIRSFQDLEQMVEEVFQLIDKKKIRCTKQTQAYLRTLEFMTVSRDDAMEAWNSGLVSSREEAKRVVQDYVMGLIMNEQQKRKLPHQVHTGMTNLPDSNPALLRPLVEAYPQVDFILLHCYPYISEAAYLARNYKNVYLDSAWLALQSPALLYKALNEWIGFVPYGKIFLSGDATSVEEAYGSHKITREVLIRVLEEKTAHCELDQALAFDIAHALLQANARRMYGMHI